jgi:hypothetical protein
MANERMTKGPDPGREWRAAFAFALIALACFGIVYLAMNAGRSGATTWSISGPAKKPVLRSPAATRPSASVPIEELIEIHLKPGSPWSGFIGDTAATDVTDPALLATGYVRELELVDHDCRVLVGIGFEKRITSATVLFGASSRARRYGAGDPQPDDLVMGDLVSVRDMLDRRPSYVTRSRLGIVQSIDYEWETAGHRASWIVRVVNGKVVRSGPKK